MLFSKVALAAIGYVIPSEIVTSDEIEAKLSPLYQRLKLPEGRLELMTGISKRRMFPREGRLSDWSAESCRRAIQAADIPLDSIGCLVHASVCREFLEPATACRVHYLNGLPQSCWTYDVSNACLGVLNGLVQIAALIESGSINAGLVVGSEDARGLITATLEMLNTDVSLTRQSMKSAFASLTIGSGSCALLLVNKDKFRRSSTVHGAVARSHSQFHELCQSDTDQAGSGMLPTMQTDSEQLLHGGVATGKATFDDFLFETKWTRGSIDASVCHQVGTAHRKLMLEQLDMPVEKDFATFPVLGNTGSVALPTALAIGLHSGGIQQPSRLALLGIGSGINSVMVGLDASDVAIEGNLSDY